MSRPDEAKIVDRDTETDLFARTLPCDGPRRVLVVSDKSGMGKSDLLRKLRYLCEYIHEVPVALVDLADFQNRPEEFPIIEQLHKELSREAAFPTFDALNTARAFKDAHKFYQQAVDVRGVIDLTDAEISGGTLAGTVFQIEHAENVGTPDWSEQAEDVAKALCKRAFFTELMSVAHDRPVVILLDTIDKTGEELRRWLFRDLLKDRVLTNWAEHRVILVMAGKDLYDLVEPRIHADLKGCVEPITIKTEWTSELVEEFLAVHGFGTRVPALDADEIGFVCRQLANGAPLTKVLTIAEDIVSQEYE